MTRPKPKPKAVKAWMIYDPADGRLNRLAFETRAEAEAANSWHWMKPVRVTITPITKRKKGHGND